MNNDKISKLYKIRFTDSELPRKNEIWKIICRYIQQFIASTDTVLDVACGHGEFINNIFAKRKIAIDINKDAQKFLNNDVQFYHCDATNISSTIDNNIDVIFSSNFLEHLPNKKTLDIFLEQVLLSLKTDGKYIILGPNLRYIPGKYWDFYDHHLGLTHLSLCEALQLKGFKIHICIDRFLPYTTQGNLPTHPFLVQAYLKIPIIWPLLGRQFFIIATK